MAMRLKKAELIDEGAIEVLGKDALIDLAKEWRQRILDYESVLFRVKRRFFGRKSERSASSQKNVDTAAPMPRGETKKLPSERYPDAQVREDDIDFKTVPLCPCCGATMQDSGMTEDSEYLDVKEKEFIVVQQKRHKHRCPKCHGAIATAPVLLRVISGGSYSDEMIIDATLSKYCDLIPMERYCEMAGRGGFPGLPPHSLIQASFKLAEFLGGLYELVKKEVLDAKVLRADETPHRMLEGDPKKRWYLWGFSNEKACFFECHDTRSGDVSTEVLKQSSCEVLLSDVYSGYIKSLKVANKIRTEEGRPPIQPAYCNSHARREFYSGDDDSGMSADAKFMVDKYEEIYALEAQAKGRTGEEILEKRLQMQPLFEAMKDEALQKVGGYSAKSAMGGAYSYFINNYDGLTLFLLNPAVPTDNNGSERLLRSPVVGRKTWYGTHSREGARTAAVHFSIVETCKLNGVNPRQYYADMIDRIHSKQDLLTPRQYRQQKSDNTC